MLVGIVIIYHLSQLFGLSCSCDSGDVDMSNNFKCVLIDVICLLWVTTGFSFLMLLRLSTQHGFGHCTFLILCVWNVDNGALFAGSSFRSVFKQNDILGQLLFPKSALNAMTYLSPSKSWTGVLGGLALGMMTAVLLAKFGMDQAGDKEGEGYNRIVRVDGGEVEQCYLFHRAVTLPCWSEQVWCLLGVGISLLAVVGDMFESSLKRYVKIKDSGSFFPGHGGCLDRMDSALIAGVWYFNVVQFLEQQQHK
jgi:phosphatidate cytidylyltransferase